MAGILNKLKSTIGRWLHGKPKPPKISGHRGIASGSRANPNLDRYAERFASGHETISEEESEEFLSGLQPVFVMSSNVAMVQFFPDQGKMMVEFLAKGNKPASAYLYSQISYNEALSFLQSQSKGGWVWDNLRIRGTKSGHKKPYVKIR